MDKKSIGKNLCIGVIVPIYNVERYLLCCLNSLQYQTYSNFIAILVNDGSTDKSLDIAKKYCMIDNRFILIDSKINQGLSRARNLGIDFFQKKMTLDSLDKYQYRIVNSPNCELFSILSHQQLSNACIDYLVFLDSDDYLDKKAFEIFLSYAVRYCLDLVCAGVNRIDSEYRMVSSDYGIMEYILKKTVMNGLKLVSSARQGCFYCVWNVCINFSFFNKLKIRFIENIIYEDHCFGIELFINAQRVMVIQDFLYNQVCSVDSITRPKHINYDRLLLEYKSWRDTIDNLEKLSMQEEARKIVKKYIRKFYYPSLVQSFLKLAWEDKKKRRFEFRKYGRYSNLKTFIMFTFPKIYNYFRKYKN